MTVTTDRFTIRPDGPYRLATTIETLGGFCAAGMPGAGGPVLRLAFPVDGCDQVAAIDVRQARPDGPVEVGLTSAAPVDLVHRQVARLLSLDHGGDALSHLAARDPVIGTLLGRRPGFRPAGFWSPYEAATWAVISQRVQTHQAGRVREAIRERFGTVTRHDGMGLVAFPTPQALVTADLAMIRGVGGRKPEWLRGVAMAAMAGHLDADHLRALPPDDALRVLRGIPGIGPFSANLVLVRGAMPVDVPPMLEDRLARSVRAAYALGDGSADQDVADIVASWTPARTWAGVLVRSVA